MWFLAGRGAAAWAAVGLAVAIVAIAAVKVRSTRWLVAGLLFGALASGAYGSAWKRAVAEVGDAGAGEWSGAVVNDPEAVRWGTSVVVRLGDGPGGGWLARVRWPAEEPAPQMGESVVFSAILRGPDPGTAHGRRAARRGEAGSGSPWEVRRCGMRAGAAGAVLRARTWVRTRLEAVGGPGGDLLCGVLLGDRRRVSGTPLAEDFRALGLSHLLAVSGDHLAIACVAAAGVLAALGAGRRTRLWGALAAGVAFAVMTGLQVSAVRAAVMLAVGTVAVAGGRRTSPLGALSGAVILLVAERPWSVFEIGLQLSVLAVLGLALFGGLARSWVEMLAGDRERVTVPVSMTLVAQAATAAVTVPLFGVVSLAAPLANVLVVPLVSAGLVAGLAAAAAAALLPEMGARLLAVASLPMRAAGAVAEVLARAPGAAVPVDASAAAMWGCVAVAGAITWARWPVPTAVSARRAGAALVAGCVLFAAGPGGRGASIVVLDVGQGDAILVRDSGRTMLVDAGPDGSSLMRGLGRHGVRRLDSVVLTHDHDDHTGGFDALAGVVPVGWVGVPGVAVAGEGSSVPTVPGDPDAPLQRELVAGTSWRLGRTVVSVVWPEPDAAPERVNDTSIVLHLRRGAFDAVLTGDAEGPPQTAMAAAGRSGEVEVLKVPHHGSPNGLTQAGAELWSPEVAIVSVGAGNRFGHPDQAVVGMLAQAGSRVLRTDERGDVVISIERDGYRVTTSEGGRTAVSCARIRRRPPGARSIGAVTLAALEKRGNRRPEGSQAGLPHLGQGGPPARGGRGPPQGPLGVCRRPHLQHAYLRRRDRGRR